MPASYFYLLTPNHRWGDYGNTLVHGYGGLDDETGECFVQRTGPFVPPLTQPGAIVVTDDLRREMERAGFTGVTFVPATKAKIVELHWHEWNQAAPGPAEYPDGAEPGNYIDAGDHSPRTAAAMGELWALKIPAVARVGRDRPVVESRRELHLIGPTTQGLDFVRSPDVGYVFVSRRAKEWLAARVGEWVEFEKASVR